jgi:hypothetical protein
MGESTVLSARTLLQQFPYPSLLFAGPAFVRVFPALMAFLVFFMLLAASGCGSGSDQPTVGQGDPKDPGFEHWRGFYQTRRFALDFVPAPSLIQADWNADGWMDVAAFDPKGRVVILEGRRSDDSTVDFEAPRSLSAGGDPWFGAATDFDRDGKDDLAFVQTEGRKLTVWSGDGRGNFTVRDYPLPAKGRYVRTADVNNDLFRDLAVLSSDRAVNGVAVTVFLGNANGFTAGWNTWDDAQATRDLVIADVTGDRKRDIVVTSWENEKPIRIYPGLGDGQFGAAIYPGGLTNPDFHDGTNRAYTGDLNGDGTADLVTTHNINTHEMVAVRIARGGGLFHSALRFPTELPEAVTSTDINLDEQPDLIVSHSATSAVSYLLNQGGGTFREPVLLRLGRGLMPASLATADYNRDMWPDVAALNQRDRSIILMENGGTRP